MKNCKWKFVDEHGGYYETQCGSDFAIMGENKLYETGFRFCIYCGGKIKEKELGKFECVGCSE